MPVRKWSWLLLSVLLTACVKPIAVRAPVMFPAAVPVRAFPTIYIAGGELPEGDLGRALAEHLARDGQHSVQQVAVKELEPMHEAGAFAAYSLVVLVEPGLYADAEGQWELQPVSMCDLFYGCYTQYQNVYGSAPEVSGKVKLTIFEGPTAVSLQTIEFEAAVSGADTKAARKQVLELLAQKLARAVDVLKSETHVELEPVKHPIVSDAISHIRKGEWDEGRALLETAAQALGGLTHRLQARIWYDLAIARWYAPGPAGLTQPAFEAARRALELAIQLDGSGRYRSALDGLTRARQRAKVLEEQRSAARHNYALKVASDSLAAPAPAATGVTPGSP